MPLILSMVLAVTMRSAPVAPIWKPGFGLAAVWNDGNAEVSRYEARDPRYGIPRESIAVLIVVAEDLRRDRLVKADRPEAQPTIRVLKLNQVRSIPTGVYTYQQMLSAFLEADRLDAVKLTVASHEWCGNTFVEWRRDRPFVQIRTYFEDPGDVDAPFTAGDALFYDALPLKLRGLDFGRTRDASVRIVDTLFSSRPAPPAIAEGRLSVTRLDAPAPAWRVTLTRGERKDVFDFETAFPHGLLRWERSDGGSLRRIDTRRFHYWEKNHPGDERLLSQPGTR
jgi:hypothetical protein